MKTGKWTFIYGSFATLSLICLFLMLNGCSGETTKNSYDPLSGMPSELKAMQGTWKDSNTNDAVECTVIIQDYTIRVRYQPNDEQPQQKQNASIDRLDEERHFLILNGGAAAWPYSIEPENGKEHLDLEFFDSDGWHQLDLFRTD